MPFPHFYDLKLGLNASGSQAQMIEKLKADGDEVIQTANGLCVRSNKSADELTTLLKSVDASGSFQLAELHPDKIEETDHSKDVKTFVTADQ